MDLKNKISSFFYTLFVDNHHSSFVSRIGEVVKRMKYSEKIFFYLISSVFVVSGILLLFQLNKSFLVEVPAFGGSFTED